MACAYVLFTRDEVSKIGSIIYILLIKIFGLFSSAVGGLYPVD